MRKPAPLVRWVALAAIVFVRVASRASAQEVLAQAFGSAQFEEFGFSIAGGGPDLDGDGFAEIAVHARITQSGSSVFTGSATVLSGRDLTPIHTIYGANSYDQLGFSLAWCDDLDGDALADLVVGLPYSLTLGLGSAGRVQIYSTATWTLLREWDGGAVSGIFGYAIATLRDADGDGVAELVVGAPGETNGPSGRGAIYVYSGASGALIRRITVAGSDLLGYSVADVGDVDGDGLDDIGSGAPSSTYVVPEAGYAYVLSGADGSVLLQWHGDSKKYRTSYGGTTYLGNNFGTRIGGAGDIDGDGRADVWVATEHGLPRPAFIAVYSGATGAMLRKFESTDVQVAAAALGDLTSDGIPEFGAGGQLFSGSSWRDAVLLFDGSDGKELWRGERPDGNANWGGALAATEDVNQDGLRDFAVGASMDDTNAFNTGRVDLLAANDLWLDVQPTHFPTAKDLLTVSVAEGPTGNLVALFLTDVNGTPIFALLGLTTFGAAGQAQWSGKIPSGYAGNTFALQSFAVGRRGRLVSSTAETIAIQ